MMKRKTFWNGKHYVLLVNGQEITGGLADYLAAYENTGLTPEEINRVVATLQTVQANKHEMFLQLKKYLDAEAKASLSEKGGSK